MRVFSRILVIYLLLVIVISINDNNATRDIPLEPEGIIINHPPDSSRKVLYFDWEEMDYIYEGEQEKPKGTWKEPKPYPDAFVVIQGQSLSPSRTPNTVIIKGQRYRILTKPDNTWELIPIR